MDHILADLRAEGLALDALVADLPAEHWRTPTPAAGWTVAHQIGHLAWTDDIAALTTGAAAGDTAAADAFAERTRELIAHGVDAVDRVLDGIESEPPAELLARWRAGRETLCGVLAQVPSGARIGWFGPPMSAASMATARIMETWAHGQDVADALGVEREPTARLRHVAHIGVRTRDFAYISRGEQPPAEPFRVELTAPDGSVWAWGPDDAANRITGSALDFCLLATQRAHLDDLDTTAHGPDAERWLHIAQAFAGPPGEGRAAGSRTKGLNA